MIHQMFSVPVGIYDGDHDALNAGLLEAIRENPIHEAGVDLLKRSHPAIAELRQLFLKNASEMLAERFPEFRPTLKNGWANQHDAITDQPAGAHAHPHSILAAVYYPQAPEGCGDLLLQDPNAGTMWANYTDGPFKYMVYKRIPPKAGRMVLFPGHIVHSVAPAKVVKPRVSIAVNFGVEYV